MNLFIYKHLETPEEIVMIVTEPLTAEPEVETPLEDAPLEEPLLSSESPVLENSFASPEMVAANIPVPPPVEPVFEEPVESLPEETSEETPVEETPVDESPKVPEDTVEASEETEEIETETAEEDESSNAPVEDTAESEGESSEAAVEANVRSLNELLSEIRRARQQSRETQRTAATGVPSPSTSPGRSSTQSTATAPAAPAPPDSGRVSCGNCPQPQYPQGALEDGAEGSVRVSVDVDDAGQVIGVTLIGSSGNPELDQAMETVRRQWQFQGVDGGATNIPVQVDMTLEGSDFNREATERGDRQEISVPSAAPVAVEEPEQPAASNLELSGGESPLPETSPSPEEEVPAVEAEANETVDSTEPAVDVPVMEEPAPVEEVPAPEAPALEFSPPPVLEAPPNPEPLPELAPPPEPTLPDAPPVPSNPLPTEE